MKEPDNEPSASTLVVVPSLFTSSDVNLPLSFLILVFLPLPEVSLRISSFTSSTSSSSFSSKRVTLLFEFNLNFLEPELPIEPPIVIDFAPISAGELSDLFFMFIPPIPAPIPIPPMLIVLPTNQMSWKGNASEPKSYEPDVSGIKSEPMLLNCAEPLKEPE